MHAVIRIFDGRFFVRGGLCPGGFCPDTPIEVEALTINKVCNKLRPVNIDISKYSHSKDIKFVDSYPRGPTEINILLVGQLL